MNVFIKKNSTLPKIKYHLKQHILEKLDITESMLENVAITFSMVDENNRYRVANAEANLEIIEDVYERLDDSKYMLTFKPRLKDTKKNGVYWGEFKLDFLDPNCGKITLPADKKIKIIIQDSITKTSINPNFIAKTFGFLFDETFS